MNGTRSKLLKSVRAAEAQTVPPPGALDDLFLGVDRVLNDEDDGSAHRTLRAATREGDSAEVVVLHRLGDRLALDPAGPALDLPTDGRPGTETVRRLLGAGVRVSTRALVAALRADTSATSTWWAKAVRKSPALRYTHLVVLENGSTTVGGHRVSYDPRLGLVIAHASA